MLPYSELLRRRWHYAEARHSSYEDYVFLSNNVKVETISENESDSNTNLTNMGNNKQLLVPTNEMKVQKKGKKKTLDTTNKTHATALENEKTDKTSGKNEDKDKLGQYLCCVCSKDFTTEEDYASHLEKHCNFQMICKDCKKVFKYASLLEYATHARVHSSNKSYKCYFCDFATSVKTKMRTHLQTHDSNFKYKCDKCDFQCNLEIWFAEHKNVHNGDKPFICKYCSERFTGSRELMAHKRDEDHYNDDIECEHCESRFTKKKHLVFHMRWHRLQAGVLCDVCGKRLSNQYHLNVHKRTHTGQKPYECPECKKCFTTKDILTQHIKVHKGQKHYRCTICGKCFSQRSSLTIHKRYHSGDRPYVCPLCNKGFVSKAILGSHLKQSKH